jgi:hypothetical protein
VTRHAHGCTRCQERTSTGAVKIALPARPTRRGLYGSSSCTELTASCSAPTCRTCQSAGVWGTSCMPAYQRPTSARYSAKICSGSWQNTPSGLGAEVGWRDQTCTWLHQMPGADLYWRREDSTVCNTNSSRSISLAASATRAISSELVVSRFSPNCSTTALTMSSGSAAHNAAISCASRP